jgi:hypothetical protein
MSNYDPYSTMRFQQNGGAVDHERVFWARVKFLAMLCVAACVAIVITGEWSELPVMACFAVLFGAYVAWVAKAPKGQRIWR